MNGIWNRSPAIILRLVLVFTLALLVGGMGGGDENLTGGLPLPEKNFVVGITDRTGMQTKSSRLTWEGKVYFRGKYGEATVNLPFAKISQVDFRPANTAETPFGELEISVADLRQLDFSE